MLNKLLVIVVLGLALYIIGHRLGVLIEGGAENYVDMIFSPEGME